MPSHNGLILSEWKRSQPEVGVLDSKALANWAELVKTYFRGDPKYAVFYLDYGIRFAKWESGGFVYEDRQTPSADYLQLVRIFNAERELKIWKQDEAFHYRLRVDEKSEVAKGEVAFAVDAEQFLWGTQILKQGGGWTRLFEERGTELCLPLEVAEIKVKAKLENGKEYEYQGLLVALLTRNYIAELDSYTRQATYADCRFVDLKLVSKEDIRRLLKMSNGETQNA